MTTAVDAEITALMQRLQMRRNHLLGAVEGLSDEALRRPVLPSGWSCLAMVQHLTLSVERMWFRAVVAGEPEVIDLVGSQRSGWRVNPGLPADTRLAVPRTRDEVRPSAAIERGLVSGSDETLDR